MATHFECKQSLYWFWCVCDCVGHIYKCTQKTCIYIYLNTYTIDSDFHTLMIKKEWVLDNSLYKDDVMYVTWFIRLLLCN